jgi:hypothetical protein
LAIIKRSDADRTPQPEAAGTIAIEEPAAQRPAAAPPSPAPAQGPRTIAETLPSALEPELRRIIDTAVARVAAIELDAIREARELTQRSEQEAREALRFALDRAFNLINTLELLASTVGGMAEALKIELDDAIEALRNVPKPESELAPAQPEPETPQPEPVPEAAPAPEAAEAPPVPEPEPEPPPAEPPAAEAQPEPEAVVTAETPAPAAEEAAHPASSNGQPPAESASEPEPEIVTAAASADGKPAVPARRRGLMRRLFSK